MLTCWCWRGKRKGAWPALVIRNQSATPVCCMGLTSRLQHTRRITTEAKAKVVTAAWGTALFHFFAALAILNPDDLKTRTNCTRTIWRILRIAWIVTRRYEEWDKTSLSSINPGAKYFENSKCGKAWFKSVPQTAATTFAFSSFLIFFLWATA